MKKKYSLKRNEEIGKIVHSSKCVKNDSFVVYYNDNEVGHSRICISVSKKNGKAFIRNKIKRQTRMMITDIFNFDLSKDYVVVIRKKYLELDFSQNKDNLLQLITKLKSNKE